MNDSPPRLRMFAGPNGSGKTTVKQRLNKSSDWFGVYINPDELELELRNSGLFDLTTYGIHTTTNELQLHFNSSDLLQNKQLLNDVDRIQISGNQIVFQDLSINSYHASVLADFLRRQLLKRSLSFSFETVMSSPDKIDLLREAQQQGYRTYLYYIATEAPQINIQRVKNRVIEGGHDVPEDKIINRYFRSLELLATAIQYTNRAFFFDSSEENMWYFAEATDGRKIELKSSVIPRWFENIWNHFGRVALS